MTNPIDTSTEPDEGGAEAPSGHAAASEPPAAGEHPSANDKGAQGDSGPDGADNEPKASKLRQRAQQAEGERDRLADALARLRQIIVDAALQARGFHSERLCTAAMIDPATLVGEDGVIDATLLDAAVEEAAADLGVKAPARRPIPNPLVGQGQGGRRATSGREDWDSAFGR